ncbi:putative two component regulator response regulator transcriptional regulatory protein [uncultured Stenotrophomonas sp.]|uniref:Putative two component regulator response regulator transcriptional regulatory protein n=1 Tax=uncultured Stenotrophomonas sp. TaxID=165438 RepID=A0A1Y5Q267_9GAMM|nr:putative two component regulator response regulator transcriptional regulatory protein [uncultured Stenotrophomonas sp.]
MNTQQQANPPRLLLVEDDATSQAFFHTTLMALPATVDTAASLADARQLAQANRHALWLVDANLPDGTGPELLRYLRTRQAGVPALAHTADTRPETRQALLQAGFDRVLLKPLAGSALLASVREALAATMATPAADALDWDESAALQALNGQSAHVVALRELFMTELPGARAAVSSALQQHDTGALRAQLHRLQASCGFVGASRLGSAVRQLHQAPDSDMARRQFDAAVNALLHH